MKVTLRQFNRMIREAAARKSAGVEDRSGHPEKKAQVEQDNPTMPVDAALYESQRGNDENSQHDNDTDPGDPMLKHLKEAALRDIRLADKILRRR